jgi:hypothetical protein
VNRRLDHRLDDVPRLRMRDSRLHGRDDHDAVMWRARLRDRLAHEARSVVGDGVPPQPADGDQQRRNEQPTENQANGTHRTTIAVLPDGVPRPAAESCALSAFSLPK